jgi:hypothetical protein
LCLSSINSNGSSGFELKGGVNGYDSFRNQWDY